VPGPFSLPVRTTAGTSSCYLFIYGWCSGLIIIGLCSPVFIYSRHTCAWSFLTYCLYFMQFTYCLYFMQFSSRHACARYLFLLFVQLRVMLRPDFYSRQKQCSGLPFHTHTWYKQDGTTRYIYYTGWITYLRYIVTTSEYKRDKKKLNNSSNRRYTVQLTATRVRDPTTDQD
jgi:hypothetical protein